MRIATNPCYRFFSEVSLTVGIVFVRVTCKLFEFIGFFYSGHVKQRRNKGALQAHTVFFPFLDTNNSNNILKCIFTDRVVNCKIIFSEPAIKMGINT